MSKFTAKPFTVNLPPVEIAEKFADLTALQPMLDKMPEEQRKQVGDISFTTDSIGINTAQMGQVRFKVAERSDSKVVLQAEGTPVPMAMEIDLKPEAADTATEATCSIDLEVPMMLRPMIAPHLQKAVDKFSEVIQQALR